MRLYLLRHGETDWNKEGRLQGHRDIPMNATGVRQVEAACRKLAPLRQDIRLICTSPLQRARKSAEMAAGALGYPAARIEAWPDLIERGFGEGEGLNGEERQARFPDKRFPGLESEEEIVERAGRVLERCKSLRPEGAILLVAHGAFLKALMAAALGKAYGDRELFIVEPASLHLLEEQDGRFFMRSL